MDDMPRSNSAPSTDAAGSAASASAAPNWRKLRRTNCSAAPGGAAAVQRGCASACAVGSWSMPTKVCSSCGARRAAAASAAERVCACLLQRQAARAGAHRVRAQHSAGVAAGSERGINIALREARVQSVRCKRLRRRAWQQQRPEQQVSGNRGRTFTTLPSKKPRICGSKTGTCGTAGVAAAAAACERARSAAAGGQRRLRAGAALHRLHATPPGAAVSESMWQARSAALRVRMRCRCGAAHARRCPRRQQLRSLQWLPQRRHRLEGVASRGQPLHGAAYDSYDGGTWT